MQQSRLEWFFRGDLTILDWSQEKTPICLN